METTLPPRKPSRFSKMPTPVRFGVVVALLAMIGVVMFNLRSGGEPAAEQVGLVDIYDRIENGEIVKAELNDGAQTVTVETDDGTTYIASYPVLGGSDIVEVLRENGVTDTEVTPASGPSMITGMITMMLPLLLIFGLIFFMIRKTTGSALNFAGKTSLAEIPNVKFSDVIGSPEAVDDLTEVVEVLRNPEAFVNAGARVPKGVLLVGPPGTGKTLLAKAVAAEADCAFFSASGSDFVEMFVGVGARRIRDLFATARKAGKAVVFIDEIDGVGRARATGASNGATDERESTLNALLTEMDGFTSGNIVVIAATNRPELLDKALVRAGRFDRTVHVPLPDRGGRVGLFKFYLNDAAHEEGFDVDEAAEHLARRSTGLSGADIANVVNEAKLLTAKNGNTCINMAIVNEALERVAMGRERRSTVMTPQERRIVAYHEAGHTVAALMLDDFSDPMQVTIVPRGGAGGVTWLDPGDSEHFITRSAMHSHLVVAMGGRAAEKRILNGDYTQGASGDIAAATARATQMVCAYGMSDLGPVAIDPDRLMGEDAAAVRKVVQDIVEKAAATADELIDTHSALLDTIAEQLLDVETLSREQLRELVAGEPVAA